jgi:hypothetical protein
VASSPDSVVGVAETLISSLDRDLGRDGRLGKVSRYLAGDHDLPYAPSGAKREFMVLARKSITPWLPLVSDTFAKGLFVDGYRPAKSTDNSKPWTYWQANGLDARQTIAHRGALEYGTSYLLVLPGSPSPLMRPLAPTRTMAFYEDEDDEFPTVGLISKGRARDGGRLFQVLDDENVYLVRFEDGKKPVIVSTDSHSLGVTPMVRFRDRLDGEAKGIISPLYALQDRINEATFSLMIALQYASFRQRWATGMAIPMDEDPGTESQPNPNFGKPVEAFESAVNRLWITDNPEAKFGDFSQTDVSGHLRTYEMSVRTLAAVAQTPPNVLLGDLVNLSADALAAAEASTQRKMGEYETIFGEAWEQSFRLAAAAAGDRVSAADTSSQVRWRDTEARSLAATVDALGKMTQMLAIPAQGLWDRIPGVTDQDVEAWRAMATEGDSLSALADALTRQSATPN